jgi:hypothetical protein
MAFAICARVYVVVLEGIIPALLSPKVIGNHGLRGMNLNLRSEYIVSRIHLENFYDSLKEVHDFLVFLVSRLVAGNVECGCTSAVL